MPSTSWQWDPEAKAATCCYCGFTTVFTGDSPGQIGHNCDPTKHPALTARQGLPIGRSPRPEAASRIPLDQLLTCIHRGPELWQAPCDTCGGGVRIKVFACAIHGECQFEDKIVEIKCCGDCVDREEPRP